jgi:hypothetical protein
MEAYDVIHEQGNVTNTEEDGRAINAGSWCWTREGLTCVGLVDEAGVQHLGQGRQADQEQCKRFVEYALQNKYKTFLAMVIEELT